jgi:nucleotide-binding universal stress UspA family protein
MRVLIALDDSSVSQAALESVKSRVWSDSTSFFLCTVVPATADARFFQSCNPAVMQKLRTETYEQATILLKSSLADLRTVCLDNSISCGVGFGDVSDKIVYRATKWGADVIVMGSHTLRRDQLYALGSVAGSVSEKARCDVEIIKDQQWSGATSSNDQSKILVCYDGSPHSRAALEWIANGTWTAHQAFVIVTVLACEVLQDFLHYRKVDLVKGSACNVQQMQNHLNRRVLELRKYLPHNPIETLVLEGYAAETILYVAESLDVELLVLGAHSDHVQIDPLLGSVVRQVVSQARCCAKVLRQRPSLITGEARDQFHSAAS